MYRARSIYYITFLNSLIYVLCKHDFYYSVQKINTSLKILFVLLDAVEIDNFPDYSNEYYDTEESDNSTEILGE